MIPRSRLSALVLMAAIVIGTAGTPAAAARPMSCVNTLHDCGAAAAVASCCCHRDDGQQAPARTEGRTQLAPDLSIPCAVLPVVSIVAPSATPAAVHGLPLRGSPPDLLTLYATLLI